VLPRGARPPPSLRALGEEPGEEDLEADSEEDSEADNVSGPDGGPPEAWQVVGLGFDAFIRADSLSIWRRVREANAAEIKGRRKRHYNMTKRRAKTAARLASAPSSRAHNSNGRDPERVRRVLQHPCLCKNKCYPKLKIEEAQAFLDNYWGRSKADRDSLLSLALAHRETAPGGRVQWEFLSHEISLRCLAKILGHRREKLERAAAGDVVLDQRTCRPVDIKMHSELDSFFMTLYLSVAEPLPTKSASLAVFSQRSHMRLVAMCVHLDPTFQLRFMHRGRRIGPRSLESDSDKDDYLQSQSETEATEVWFDTGVENFAFHTMVPNKLAVRWLPPGSPALLFQEYLGVMATRGSKSASWMTFLRYWKARWNRILHFRAKSTSGARFFLCRSRRGTTLTE
jgi:hypothetical protein